MPRQVTAFSNTTVKRLRSLRDKKARRAEGLFLAEGLRIIAEARDSERLPEIIAFSAEGAKHPLAAEIIAATEAAGGEAIETTSDILSKMSGKDNPQMLLAAYRQPATSLQQVDRSVSPVWIVAQSLRDPGNIGTILRTGDAVGAGGLILVDDCADAFSVEAVRAS
ncbi:MAG TPA: TrmH family RNA methyltransferase, partial [Sphingomicrobium sp.]|nr:TrmH family RNA methyltransferase [Sphingomicrobium sp.]